MWGAYLFHQKICIREEEEKKQEARVRVHWSSQTSQPLWQEESSWFSLIFWRLDLLHCLPLFKVPIPWRIIYKCSVHSLFLSNCKPFTPCLCGSTFFSIFLFINNGCLFVCFSQKKRKKEKESWLFDFSVENMITMWWNLVLLLQAARMHKVVIYLKNCVFDYLHIILYLYKIEISKQSS